MKGLYLFFALLTVAAGLLLLDQLWFGFVSFADFWKILATLAIVAVVGTLVYLIRHEFLDDKRLKNDDYVD